MPSGKVIHQKYSEEDVLGAIAAVESGFMTYREAAQKYKIPISSLCDRVKKRVPLLPSKGVKLCISCRIIQDSL